MSKSLRYIHRAIAVYMSIERKVYVLSSAIGILYIISVDKLFTKVLIYYDAFYEIH